MKRELIVGWEELSKYVGRHPTTLKSYIRTHRFPRPMVLCEQRNKTLWYKDKVDAWLKEPGLPEIKPPVSPGRTKRGRYI